MLECLQLKKWFVELLALRTKEDVEQVVDYSSLPLQKDLLFNRGKLLLLLVILLGLVVVQALFKGNQDVTLEADGLLSLLLELLDVINAPLSGFVVASHLVNEGLFGSYSLHRLVDSSLQYRFGAFAVFDVVDHLVDLALQFIILILDSNLQYAMLKY